jgi:hypothetical protein
MVQGQHQDVTRIEQLCSTLLKRIQRQNPEDPEVLQIGQQYERVIMSHSKTQSNGQPQ